MRAATLRPAAAEKLSKAACVRWKEPADELIGLARVAHALVDAGQCQPRDVCFAVPNLNWAVQMKRACDMARLASTVCLPPARVSRQAHEALAALDVLAAPMQLAAREAYAKFGHVDADIDALAKKCSALHGFTLIKVLGIDRIHDFSHALYHVSGTEAAREMAALLRERTAHPAIPAHVDVTPILDYRKVAEAGEFSRVFLVGCVDGLVPGPAAFEAATPEQREAAMDACRAGFEGALLAARDAAVVSYFEKIDASIADAAHIRHARRKTEHGRKLAMCAPASFLAEAGALRPTTQGGQTFLRDFNLN